MLVTEQSELDYAVLLLLLFKEEHKEEIAPTFNPQPRGKTVK